MSDVKTTSRDKFPLQKDFEPLGFSRIIEPPSRKIFLIDVGKWPGPTVPLRQGGSVYLG